MTSIVVQKSAGNPTLNFAAIPENIIKVGSTYWTCYRGDYTPTRGINLASAPDPEGPWTAYGGNPVISPGSGWESGRGLDTPFLLDLGGGSFRIYYAAVAAGPGAGGIGYADAPDVTGPYTKNPSNPILDHGSGSDWDSLFVWDPCPVELPDTTWLLFFGGSSTTAPTTSGRIGYATGPSADGPFTKAPANPVLTPGANGSWDDIVVAHPHVWIDDDDLLWMLYTGIAGTGGGTPVIGFPWGVGIATATDPDGPWDKHNDNPFLAPGGAGAWDEGGPFRGGVYEEGADKWIIFGGINAAGTVVKGGTATLAFVEPTTIPEGWDVYAPGDPNGDIVVTLENAYGRSFRDELHGAGKGSFKINRYAPEVASLVERSIVKVRIPELGDDYVYAFELQDVAATLAAAAEKGVEELEFSGPGVLAYLDHAEMLDRAFTTGLDVNDTWAEIWRSSIITNPVGSAVVSTDQDYVYIISSTTRRIYKVRQSDRKIVRTSPALWAGSTRYAGGLGADPADDTILWVLESPWAFGGSGNTKIRKVRISDWHILATFDLGSAVQLTEVKADATNLWVSKYDGPDIQKRSKATGAVVTSYSIDYLGVAQVHATGVSVNGTQIAYWFEDKKRALIASTAAPTVITDVIKTTGISAFGGEWTTEGVNEFFYPVTYTADVIWKYQVTSASPHDPVDDVWRLDEGTSIAIAKRLYDEWTDPSRPVQPIAAVTVDFTALLDSDGNAAAAADGVLEYTAKVGDKGLPTVMRLTRYGTTFRMSPNLLWSAYNSFGVNRSSATFASGKVRLEKGVSIVSDVQRRVNTQRLDTYMLAKGADRLYAEAELSDVPYVSEGFVSTEQSDATALAGTAAAELDQERVRAESVALGIRWGNDQLNGKYLPYVHYGPGDTVRVHTGSELYDYDEESMLLYAIQVDENKVGGWAAFGECQSGFKRSPADASSSGSASSGGGTGGTSTSGGSSTSARVTLRNPDTGDEASGTILESTDVGPFQAGPGVVGFSVLPKAEDPLEAVLGASIAPASALRRFYAALQTIATAPVDIVVVGDSLAVGEAAATSAARYVEVLAERLATKYSTSPAAIYYPAIATAVFAMSPWTIVGAGLNVAYGLGRYANDLGAGDSMSIAFTGDAFKIFWTRQVAGGTFSYAVDGGAATNVDTSGALDGGHVTTVTGLSGGAHTVTIARVSGTSTIEGFIGLNGTASSGLRVWPGGHGGYKMSDFVDVAAPHWIDSLGTVDPALVVISLGINDSAVPVDAETYRANLDQLVADVRGACTVQPSILILSQYKVDGIANWGDYQQAQAAAAAEDGDLAFLDLTGVFGVDELEAESYGILDADLVHPSDEGHRLIAELIVDAIASSHVENGTAISDEIDSLQDAVDAVVADVEEAAETAFLLTVDAGTPTYDDSGDDVVITLNTKWGFDTDGPYYDGAGAAAGEEGILAIDTRDGQLVVVPYAP